MSNPNQSNNDLNSHILLIYEKMDNLDIKFDSKFDRLNDSQDEVSKHMAVYNNELKRHIEGVEMAREENKLLRQYLEQKLNPIERHVSKIDTLFTFVKNLFLGLGALLALLLSFREFLVKFFFGEG